MIYKRSDKIVAADKTGDADNTGPADTQLSSGDAPNDAPKSANKDALQARQVPEGNYRNIFENAAEGIYRSSLDGRQLRANPALVALNGYKTEEEMLAAVGDIGTEWYVEPGRRLEFRRLLDEHGRVSDFESEVYRHKSRERIWISENAWLVRDEKGRALYYEGTVRDITQHKRQEARIRRLAEFHIGLMGFVAETLQRGLDEGFYQRLLARAVEVIPGAQAGSILLKNDEGRYRFVAAQNFDLPALKELRLEERELLGGKKSRRPVIVPDLRSYGAKVLNPERAALLARSGRLEEIRATLAAPVFLEDELMAVLNLDTFTMPDAFDALAVEMAEAFAVQVGALLKRLSLERQLQRLAEFRQGLVELIAESLQRGPDEGFYQRLLTRAVEVIPGAEAGSLVLLDEGRYRYAAAVNYDLEALQEVVFYDHEVTARQQGPQVVVDFSVNDALDERRRAVLLGAGRIADIKVSLAIPIKLEAQVVAFLHLDNFSNREAFDREAVAMAEALATQVAVLLKRLSLEAELHARQRALEHLANYDPLTGLPNRALFYKELDEALKESKRSGKTVGLLYLDLDGFKFVNDSLGHSSGDSLLQAVALRLTASLRKKDMVSRLGGDEFIMILSRLRQPQDAAFVAQKILDSLAQPFLLAGHKLTVSASIGIASYPDDAQEAEALIHCADTAMYRAKELGKNTYGFFTPAINALAFQRLTLEGELRRAIEERLFSLDYQPRVDLVSGRIVCFEALLRWRHPERGDIPPATVIPIAEETGLIRALGAEVLRQACLQAKAWQERGLALRVAVNLSVKRLQRFDVIEDVRKALKESGLKAERLELELTEGAIIGAPDTLAALDALKTLGVYISVDDVGTAYASNYLKRLPIDGLKIDRFFVRNIGEDPEATPSDAAIIRSIIALGKSLNLTVVGEGVETVAQLRFLQALGCHEAQGYLFSKARPADELEPLLKAGKVELQDP